LYNGNGESFLVVWHFLQSTEYGNSALIPFHMAAGNGENNNFKASRKLCLPLLFSAKELLFARPQHSVDTQNGTFRRICYNNYGFTTHAVFGPTIGGIL
jgi:hypothetical protein